MKKSLQAVGIALIALLAVSLTAQLNAQNDAPGSGNAKSATKAEDVPQAALLTERGRQLAEELRMLKRSRDSMGSKHPTLPLINKQIEAIEEQLEAWEPAIGEPAENPFRPSTTKPMMNDYDLRQMVIRLNKRVEQLEKRVSELEGDDRK